MRLLPSGPDRVGEAPVRRRPPALSYHAGGGWGQGGGGFGGISVRCWDGWFAKDWTGGGLGGLEGYISAISGRVKCTLGWFSGRWEVREADFRGAPGVRSPDWLTSRGRGLREGWELGRRFTTETPRHGGFHGVGHRRLGRRGLGGAFLTRVFRWPSEAADRWVRMRSSSRAAGSSLGSWGTSSPRKALVRMAELEAVEEGAGGFGFQAIGVGEKIIEVVRNAFLDIAWGQRCGDCIQRSLIDLWQDRSPFLPSCQPCKLQRKHPIHQVAWVAFRIDWIHVGTAATFKIN